MGEDFTERKNQLHIARVHAIIEIERFLRQAAPDFRSPSIGSLKSLGEKSDHKLRRAESERSVEQFEQQEASPQQLQRVPASTLNVQRQSIRSRHFVSTPTSTCSDIGMFLSADAFGDLQSQSQAPILSACTTEEELPPLDMNDEDMEPQTSGYWGQEHRQQPGGVRHRFGSSSTLEEIPEFRSYTMPELRSMEHVRSATSTLHVLPEMNYEDSGEEGVARSESEHSFQDIPMESRVLQSVMEASANNLVNFPSMHVDNFVNPEASPVSPFTEPQLPSFLSPEEKQKFKTSSEPVMRDYALGSAQDHRTSRYLPSVGQAGFGSASSSDSRNLNL